MNRQARAFGISLLLHAAALLIVVRLSGAAAPAGTERIIDLRILQPSVREEVASPLARLPTALRPRSRQRRHASAPPAAARPRIEKPVLPEVPPPVSADNVVPPTPVEAPVTAPEMAPETPPAPAAAREASHPEVARVVGDPAAASGGEWPGEVEEENPSSVASVTAAAAVGSGGETSSTVSPERIEQSASASPGNEQGHPQRDYSSLREIVQRNLVYPNVARRRGWEGKVTLSFIVGADGTVREIAVLESSGHGLLDRHAVATVKNISCFPAEFAAARIIVPVVYRLN